MNSKCKQQTGLVLMIAALVVSVLATMPSVGAQEGPKPEAVGLRPDAPPYALRGPHPVGTMEFIIEPDAERPLPLTVWYPALNPDGVAEEITYVYDNFVSIEGFPELGHAIANAPADTDGGPYPLVIFSHGSVEYRYAYAYLTEHLASHGFVVMAVDHTGNTIAYSVDPEVMGANMEGWAGGFVTTAVYRPVDVQRTIDYAASLTGEGQVLAGMIDLEHIGVAGHSYGGYTALVSTGARVNVSPLREWCEAQGADPALQNDLGYVMFCSLFAGSEAQILAMRGSTSQPGELWPPFDVSGVDAIVPISPLAPFSPESFEQVDIPALLIVGTDDFFPTIYSDTIRVYDSLRGDRKGLVAFENASHFFPLNECSEWALQLGMHPFCSDAVWDMARAHDLIDHFTTAFLLATLKDDADAAAALAPEAVTFPGITYETTGF